MTCVNCNNEVSSLYCTICGEKSGTDRITFKSMFSDSFSAITNMEKGFLFNLKNLLLDPKRTIEEYLRGKRKNILNPISFLVLSVTLYLIVNALLVAPRESSELRSNLHNFGYRIGKFLKVYLKYFWIGSIVWLSLSTKLIFQKYNLAEHLTISAFVIGQASLITVLGVMIFQADLIFNPLVFLSIFWMIYQIFKTQKLDGATIVLSLVTTVLFFIQLFLIMILIGVFLT